MHAPNCIEMKATNQLNAHYTLLHCSQSVTHSTSHSPSDILLRPNRDSSINNDFVYVVRMHFPDCIIQMAKLFHEKKIASGDLLR